MKKKFLSQRSLAVVLTTILLLVAIPATAVFAANSAGPLSAGTGANVDNSGAPYSWTNAGNVSASDDQYAQVTLLNTSASSDYLQATNFGFSIPADATIVGIEVAVEKSAVCVIDPCTSTVSDSQVRLIKGGTVQTTDRSSAVAWPAVDAVTNYGTASDLWGTTWTVANINATNFGVAISAGRNAGGDKIARVDHVTITVTYKRFPTLSVTNSPVTYTGTAQAAAVEGSVAGTISDVKYNGSSTVPTVVGTYAVTADFVPTDGSYENLNDASAGNFVITKAALMVTADDKTKKFVQADPAFTFTYSGLVNGETGAVIDTPPTCDVSVPHNSIGTYPIVCSGGADNNYSFSYVDGTLTVTPIATDQTFVDVPTNHWAWEYIERLYAAGITGGCGTSPLRYCPDGPAGYVTRAQMAIFLLRGIHGSSYTPPAVGGSTGFLDVQPTYWAAAWIKQLAVEGITGGCGHNNYCPERFFNRAEMAVFLLRSKHGASYSPPAVGGSTGFGDISTDYWAAAWIKQLVVEGITAGCGNGNYCPGNPVTRAEMAVFIVRTFNLP